jgi:hypothetical protein
MKEFCLKYPFLTAFIIISLMSMIVDVVNIANGKEMVPFILLKFK